MISKFKKFTSSLYQTYTDKYQIEHKVVGQEVDDKGNLIIIAQLVNSPREILKEPATKIAKDKQLLSTFSIEDITGIIAAANTDKDPIVIYNQSTVYKYYSLLAMLFGAMLITSNIASSKLASFFGITVTGGFICYPLTYVLGDIITEVYGYKRARQLIWGAIICNLSLAFFIQLTIALPPSEYWHNQNEYSSVLSVVPRIIISSLIAYGIGEFINSYVIAKLKILCKGSKLLTRILSATFISVTLDTFIFVTLAYSGIMPFVNLIYFTLIVYIQKVISELLTVPFTIWAINKLKDAEKLDVFDYGTNFTPFSLDVEYLESDNKMSGKFIEPTVHEDFAGNYSIKNLVR